MPGLVEELNIASDGEENLLHALAIPLTWHGSGASHYAVSKSERGGDVIHFFWTDQSSDYDAGHARIERRPIPLPFRLDTPEKLFNFVKAWLEEKGRDFGPESQGDGTDKEGWRVSCGRDFYEICRVEARWNYYGK